MMVNFLLVPNENEVVAHQFYATRFNYQWPCTRLPRIHKDAQNVFADVTLDKE